MLTRCKREMQRIFAEMAQEREKLKPAAARGAAGITCVLARANVFVFTNENQADYFGDGWRKGFRPVGLVRWETQRREDGSPSVLMETSELDGAAWAKKMLAAAEAEVLKLFREGKLAAALGGSPDCKEQNA